MILYVLIQLWIGAIEGKAYEASAMYQAFSPKVNVISPECFIECGVRNIGLDIAAIIVYDQSCSCQALSFDDFMTNGPIPLGNGNDIGRENEKSGCLPPCGNNFLTCLLLIHISFLS
ncbi:hypothetical protein DPMN_163758 [Dreissena polymorpha]|uniref:WSC domain-containing protein n=1 Tax=Dreissena polymorpha TaxID=45954 RepID=A0A9D4ERR8_DREPO|nr:hypothetical protein DPMN_163758 [Dreissena polymorpha]